MQLTRILREGFIAGLIGAGAVALWFLIVDIIAGRPFFTPAMLGSAVFFGEQDPAKVVIHFSRIIPYTMLHVCAFIIVGTVAAALAAEVEVAPPTLYLIVVTFAVFEFGFYIMLAVLAQPLLGALTWWNVAIGNAIAAYGMGYYLWRGEPQNVETPKGDPLGGAGEGGVTWCGMRSAECGVETRALNQMACLFEVRPVDSALRTPHSALPYASRGTARSTSPDSSQALHRNHTTV